MIYYLTYDECSYMIDPPEASDEPFSYRGRSGLNVYPRSLHRSNPRVPHELIDTETDIALGAMAYVVVVTYTDGDTFGSSGYWCVEGLYASPENAKDAADGAETGGDGYQPWDGYFARFEAAEVVPMTVLA